MRGLAEGAGQPEAEILEPDRSLLHQALVDFGMNRIRDAAYLADRDSRILYVNDATCQSLGASREQLLTLSMLDVDSSFSAEQWDANWQQLQRNGSLVLETTHRRIDGKTFPVEMTVNRFIFQDVEYSFVLARDISERRSAEQRVARLTALNRALSEISQAIVRMEQQAELFPLVCRCAVDFGGMSLAWVGQLEVQTGEIRPVAMHGEQVG